MTIRIITKYYWSVIFKVGIPGQMISESSKHMLEICILGPHLRHTESGNGACSSAFNELFMGFKDKHRMLLLFIVLASQWDSVCVILFKSSSLIECLNLLYYPFQNI